MSQSIRRRRTGTAATPSPPSRRGILAGAAVAGAAGVLPEALWAATEPDDEAQIRQLVAKSAEAIQAGDLKALKALYAPDIVSFDVGPQMASVGRAAKMQNWAMAFTVLQLPIGYEVRDLAVAVGADMAFTHSINRLSGTLKNGNRNMAGPWVRNTNVYRKVDGAWLLAHDHVSVPVDVQTGQALMSLQP